MTTLLDLEYAAACRAFLAEQERYMQLVINTTGYTDLRPQHFEILDGLNEEQGSLMPSEIAERRGTDRSGVTRLVDALRKAGYVSSTDDRLDRRKKHISITKKGLKAWEAVNDALMNSADEQQEAA